VTLPNNGAWTGVDATSVANNNVAYTVYNGGVPGANGGAQIAVTNLTSATVTGHAELLDTTNFPADVSANNYSQLSTPYLTDKDALYALKTYSTTFFSESNFAGWSTDGVASIDANGNATFPAGQTSYISYTGNDIITSDVHTINIQTNLNPGSSTTSTYGIELYSGSILIQTLVPSGTAFSGTYGTYYTYNGAEISSASYTIRITVTAGTTAATANTISLGRYDWVLYRVTNLNAATPTVTALTATNSPYVGPVAYEGQANTPISYDSADNIYWGIWGGERSYYQYNTTSGELNVFTPKTPVGGDDFYWAGAAFVPINNADYMVFGSDSGTVYVQPVASFAVQNNSFAVPQTSQIRSSIVSSGNYVYLTSAITTVSPSLGFLWQIDTNTLTSLSPTIVGAKLTYASTSTPVISNNGYIYVGTYNGYTSGTVDAYDLALNPVNIYTGDPVQSSPIVWSNTTTEVDYIYFTTNSNPTTYVGSGYCYAFNGASATGPVWAPAAATNATLQGMAYADSGNVVWGDDSNNLYIAP
jgi:hypothetical protein